MSNVTNLAEYRKQKDKEVAYQNIEETVNVSHAHWDAAERSHRIEMEKLDYDHKIKMRELRQEHDHAMERRGRLFEFLTLIWAAGIVAALVVKLWVEL